VDLVALSGANQYSVSPWALVSTVAPPIVAVFRRPPLAGAGPGPPACARDAEHRQHGEGDARHRRSDARDAGPRPGRQRAAGGGWPGLLAARGRCGNEGGQRRGCGHLDHPGDGSGRGANFLESEQADPHRQEVPAEGGQGEPGASQPQA
jgi:hypothetical protein